MTRLGWDDSFATGDETVDAQHRELFDLIARFHDTIETGDDATAIADALESLMSYAARHFAMEESLMARSDYPDRSRHAALHAHLASETDRLAGHISDAGTSMTIEVALFLHNWLRDHVLSEDRRLIEHVQRHEA